MSQKTILEKMTDAYQTANSHVDQGVRLFALKAVTHKIDKFVERKLNAKPIMPDPEGTGGLVGMLTGGMLSFYVSNLLMVDTVVAACSFLAVGIGSSIAGCALVARQSYKQTASDIKNVLPQITALQELSLQAKQGIENILDDNHLSALRESKQLTLLVRSYPDLMSRFNDLAEKENQQKNKTNTHNRKKGLEL